MKKEAKEKVCKGKNCQKSLSSADKHKHCESCRNKRAKRVKEGLIKGGGAVVGVAAIVVGIVKKS